ncbi:MAG: DUF499 domain-containing protein [Leptospiraceae bacterium]|nr:DUF499 domain-containing protein [Leptospiraceae bacterium]
MDLLITSPEEYASQIQDSYPFHPAIKDLYARFKENNGFNQTRGLIRLLRSVVANIYSPDQKKENIFLIAPNHFDLNDSAIYNLIANINNSLVNSISHDIAAQSNSVAENLDKGKKGTVYQDVAKAILISSLADTPNSVKGLTESELLLYLCAPSVDVSFIKQTVLSALKTNCWYLHIDKEGKYLFKNTQNIVAKINSIVKTYNRESSLKEVRNLLKNTFHYHQGDVYQDLQILPTIDLLQIIPDKVTLVVFEPNTGGGIHPKIKDFYENLTFKNRILFLSGERSGMESLLHQAANVKAVQHVLSEMQADKVLTNDPQYIEANDLEVKFKHYFNSAARETFTKLFYPTKSLLMEADFSMNFHSNDYRGEDQIRETLEGKQKFTRATEEDLFRQKCEARLFAAQVMEWSEVKKRAAMQPEWQWHNPSGLDKLKEKMIRQEGWRENGKYIDKGPFPPPETSVSVSEISRDEKTGTASLRLVPSHGDTIYYDFHSPPTTASLQVKEHSKFETSEMRVQFLCVDSTSTHPTGKVFHWTNRIELKYRIFQNNGTLFVELQSIPNGEIFYTTDGSNPKEVSGKYESPFPVKQKCLLQAISRKDGIESPILKFEVDPAETKPGVKIDPIKELIWKKGFRFDNTNEVYAKLTQYQKNSISLLGVRVYLSPEPEDAQVWSELNFGDKVKLSASNLTQIIDTIRPFINDQGSIIQLDIAGLQFTNGHSFLEWLKVENLEFEPGEIKQ